jgi:hypothetical protein
VIDEVGEVFVPKLSDELQWVVSFDPLVGDLLVELIGHCFKVGISEEVVVEVAE